MTEGKKSWFDRLKSGFQKSASNISQSITQIITHRKLDQDVLDELEEMLIASDLGVGVANNIVGKLAKDRFQKEITGAEIKQVLADEIEKVLKPVAIPLTIDYSKKPFIITVVGVNGSGKTTTIGKLAKIWNDDGFKIRIVAADTFRAAAVEQLKVWAGRANAVMDETREGGDAAGLVFESIEKAKLHGDDIVIIDTAGRLQNKTPLMDELKKIHQVIKKIDPSAPHATLLVLDATSGQNVLGQVESFKDKASVTGIIMTKLDGTAKGGILVAIAQKYNLPIHAIGVGETIDDLKPFTASDLAKSLSGEG